MKTLPTLLLAGALGAAPLQAAPLVDASDPERLMQLARGFGSASLERDDYGDPLITGRIDGYKYGIYFYGCAQNRQCNDVQFAAAWGGHQVSWQTINDWNRTKRYGKAYLDQDGDPAIEMSVNLKYGVSRANFDDTLDWWVLTLKEFASHIGVAQ